MGASPPGHYKRWLGACHLHGPPLPITSVHMQALGSVGACVHHSWPGLRFGLGCTRCPHVPWARPGTLACTIAFLFAWQQLPSMAHIFFLCALLCSTSHIHLAPQPPHTHWLEKQKRCLTLPALGECEQHGELSACPWGQSYSQDHNLLRCAAAACSPILVRCPCIAGQDSMTCLAYQLVLPSPSLGAPHLKVWRAGAEDVLVG